MFAPSAVSIATVYFLSTVSIFETGEIIPCKKEDNPIRISGEDAAEIVRLRTSLAEKENKILLLEDELQKAKAALEDQTKRLKEIAKLAKIKE